MAKSNEALIAVRAYEIWEREGKPHGKDREHWLQAVEELSAKPAPAKKAAPKSPPAAKLKTAAAAAAAAKAVIEPARTKTAPARKK